MSKRILSPEQIDELLKNPNVVRCSEKSITYHDDFKIKSAKQYQDHGSSAAHIFKQAGFNIAIIGRKTPKHCLQLWRKIYAKHGAEGLSGERRGSTRGGSNGKRSLKHLTDQEKIDYLENKVAYLKAENDFLARLRAKKGG